MATNIVKFALEHSAYDRGIQSVKKIFDGFLSSAKQSSSVFAQSDKAAQAMYSSFARSSEAVKKVKGEMKLLSSQIADLTLQYNRLTDAEKKGPAGQALQGQLASLKTQLSGKAGELSSILNAAGAEKMSGALGGIIGKLNPLSLGLTAAAGAAKVAKDAFAANEQVVDAWGRTTQAASSLYQGFLTSLNTGNLVGYLANMGKITAKAKELYDAIDDLSTFRAFSQPRLIKAEAAYTEAVADYRSGNGTAEQARQALAAYQDLIRQEQEKARQVYESAIRDAAARGGVSAARFREVLAGSYEDLQALKGRTFTPEYETRKEGNPVTGYTYYRYKLPNAEEDFTKFLNTFTDKQLQELQAKGAEAEQLSLKIAQLDKQASRILKDTVVSTVEESKPILAKDVMPGLNDKPVIAGSYQDWQNRMQTVRNSFADATAEEYQEMQAYLKDLEQQFTSLFGTAIPQAAEGSLDYLNEQLREALRTLNAMPANTEEWAEQLEKVKDAQEAVNAVQARISDKKKEETAANQRSLNDYTAITSAVSQLGSAMADLTDIKGINVLSYVASAIGQLVSSFAAAMAKAADPVSWIAFAISGTATLVSTIASIKSATQGFAEGGIVGGNSPSGDNILARVNSGEGILTANGVNNLGSMLSQQSSVNNLNLTATIHGSDIVMAARNAQRRKGNRGEYLTAN